MKQPGRISANREDIAMLRLSGMLAGSLLALSALPLGAAAESGKSWTIYGGDTANTRFSALAQINRGNVAKLRVAWVAQLGSLEALWSWTIR
jgi:glucose dehydrogenase